MGFFDKVLNVMKLDSDDDFEYDNDDYEFEEEPVITKKQPSKEIKQEESDFDLKKRNKEKPVVKPTSKITPIRSSRTKTSVDMEVCVIRPSGIEDEREITDTLLDGVTVVLNIEGLSVDVAQRIIDFTSGSCYAIGGKLQKISSYIFIITPANVDISGDIQSYFEGFDTNSFKSEF